MNDLVAAFKDRNYLACMGHMIALGLVCSTCMMLNSNQRASVVILMTWLVGLSWFASAYMDSLPGGGENDLPRGGKRRRAPTLALLPQLGP
jgi:hypothetical protein